MANGKQKGSEFERYISKYLSKWITGNDKIIMWRSRNSGGWYTEQQKKNKNLNDSGKNIGDICPTEPEQDEFFNNFSIECKFYQEMNFYNFINNNLKDGLVKDYNKILKQSSEKNKSILFIIKINRKGIFLLSNFKMNDYILYFKNLDSYLYKFEDIFDNIGYEEFMKMVRK